MSTEPAPDNKATMTDYASADFDALLSGDDVKKIEAIAQNWGIARRIGISLLSRSKAQLVDGIDSEEKANVMLEMSNDIHAYTDHLKSQIEMMEAASIRIMSALATVAIERQF